LYVVDNALLIPIFLALYLTLKRTSESFTLIATALGLVGIVALFASRTTFDMLYLSNQYAAATTDAQRSLFLAAGQAMLAIYNGTAFHLSYVAGSVAGVIVSFVMLRSKTFSKTTAYAGILANVLGLGLYLPKIGIMLSVISVVPFLAIWYIFIALRFFHLGRPGTKFPQQ